MHRQRILLSICLIAVLLSGCMFSRPRATGTKTTTTVHVPNSPVNIATRNGAVEVVADTSLMDVQIAATVSCVGDTKAQAEQRLADAGLDVARDTAGTLTIQPIFPDGYRSGDGASINVRLPSAHGVTINTGNGRVVVQNLAGMLVVKTSNGQIIVTNHEGPAELETSNGAIKIDQLAGELTAETSNGAVNAEGIGGPATITTSNGAIMLALQADQPGPVHLTSSNGSIRIRVGPAFVGTVSFDTSNGGIKINDDAGVVRSKQIKKSSGTIVLGEGGAASTVQTSNGRIEFSVVNP